MEKRSVLMMIFVVLLVCGIFLQVSLAVFKTTEPENVAWTHNKKRKELTSCRLVDGYYVDDPDKVGSFGSTTVELSRLNPAMERASSQNSVPLGAEYTVIYDDFEGSFPSPNYEVGDDNGNAGLDYWDDTTHKPHWGSWSVWCAERGSHSVEGLPNNWIYKYDNYMSSYMRRGPWDARTWDVAAVRFYYWLDSEPTYDTLDFYTSRSGSGGPWSELWEASGRYGYWQDSGYIRIPDSHLTSNLWIRFKFISDSSVYYEGAYIDDLYLKRYDVTIDNFAIDAPLSKSGYPEVDPGESFTARYYIQNPCPFTVNVGLGCTIRNQVSGREYNDPSGDRVVSLSPGSHWKSRPFRVPSTAEKGLYTVFLAIWSGTPGSSRQWYSLGITNALKVGIPDLTMSFVTIDPSPPTGGQSARLWWSLDNVGKGDALETFTNKFYIDGAYVAYQTQPGLDTETAVLIYQDTTQGPGYHVHKAVADANDNVREKNEGNNVAEVKIWWKGPDLIVDDIWADPSSPRENNPFTIYFRIRNRGDASAVGTFYTRLTIDGGIYGDYPLSGLAAGATYTWSVGHGGLLEGTHTLEVITDVHNHIAEANKDTGSGIGTGESNNRKTKTVPVQPPQYKVTFQQSDCDGSPHVTVDGRIYLLPCEFWWDRCSSHTFSYESPVSGGTGVQCVLTSTSHASPIHVSGNMTITGYYKTQYYLTMSTNFGTVSPGSDWHDRGETVQILAKKPSEGPGERYVWESWTGTGSGSYTGTSNPAYITMNGPIKEEASWRHEYYVTIQQSGCGTTVTATIDGVDYCLPVEFWWVAGDTYNICVPTTIDDPIVSGKRYVFTHWSGLSSSTSECINLEVSTTGTLTANYKTQYRVTFDQSGCGNTPHVTVDGNTYTLPVTLWLDERKYTFSYESPVSGGTDTQYVLTSTSHTSPITPSPDLKVIGYYKTQYYITVISAHDKPTPSDWVDKGGSFTASVTSPADDDGAGTRYRCTGYRIDDGALQEGTSYTFTNIQAPHKIGFEWIAQYYLTVNSPYDTPGGADWYDENSTTYATLETRTVSDGTGIRYVFTHWSGDASGTNYAQSDPIHMDAPKTAVANWKIQYYLTVSTNPPDLKPEPTVSPPGEDFWYDDGTPVTCEAQNVIGCEFGNWTVDGIYQGAGVNPINVTMDGPHNAIAHYTVIGIHDVAVINVTTSKTIVGQGYRMNITVTVENQGDFTEFFNVSVFYDDTVITLPDGKNHTTTTLTSGNSTTLTIPWNTTGVAKGNYTISAYATPVPGETDTTDNTYIDGIVTIVPIGVHDVAVTSIRAWPTAAPRGQPVYVNVTVENQGGFAETFDLAVYADRNTGDVHIDIETRNVHLDIGESKLLEFVWDTTGVPYGSYWITAEALLPGDEDPTDNIARTRVGGICIPHQKPEVNILALLLPTFSAILALIALAIAAVGLLKILASPRLRWP